MYKNKVIMTMVLGLSLIVSACGQKPAEPSGQPAGGSEPAAAAKETKLDQIKKAGKIVLGTSADYPPYEFHKVVDKKDEIVGFDIEIAKTIAKDLGVELEIKDMKFEGLLAALETGNVDFILSGMTPTPERAQQVDFSKVYYTAVQTVVVRAEDKDKYNTVDSLAGKKLGVQKGAIQEEIAKTQMPASQAKPLAKISDLMLELKNNKVDALIIEEPVSIAYLARNKDLVVSDIKLATEDAGSAIALKKGAPELVEAMNKSLDKMIADKTIEKFVAEANALAEGE